MNGSQTIIIFGGNWTDAEKDEYIKARIVEETNQVLGIIADAITPEDDKGGCDER